MIRKKISKINEIWDYLLSLKGFGSTNFIRIVSTEEIFEAAKSRNFKEYSILQSMVRKGYLIPTFFKGIYLLRDPQEYIRQTIEVSVDELISMLFNYKFGDKWYFGLSSADYFSGRTWQGLRLHIVITNEFESQRKEFMGLKIVFRNLNYANFNNGIESRKYGKTVIRYSNKIRTIIDYGYYYLKLKVEAYLIIYRGHTHNNNTFIKESKSYSDYPYFNLIIKRAGT